MQIDQQILWHITMHVLDSMCHSHFEAGPFPFLLQIIIFMVHASHGAH